MATEPAPAPAPAAPVSGTAAGDAETVQPAGEGAELQQRIRAYRELYDERHVDQKKRHEKMLERNAERQKARAERFDAMLKQREEREAGIVREQEKLRDRYSLYFLGHNLDHTDAPVVKVHRMINDNYFSRSTTIIIPGSTSKIYKFFKIIYFIIFF